MKKIIIAALVALFATTLKAQTVTMDMESGDRNIDAANCWVFPGTSYTRRIQTSEVIQGFWTGKTGQLSSLTNTNGVWSPWLDMATGNITFKHKLFGGFTGVSKKVEVILQKYSDSTETTLTTFNYTSGNANTTQTTSVAVNVSGIYRVKFLFSGEGGSSRGLIDDISIPGTVNADPSNNCLPKTTIADADGDGVADVDDDFPNDKYKALKTYLSGNAFGTLLCEDLWPSKGDFDYNDLVFDYRISMITNANNEVVEINYEIVTRAIGGSYKNGFACEIIGLSPDKIRKITGNKVDGSLFKTDANGTEAGQTHANIPFFDDAFKVLTYPGGTGGINTNPDAPRAAYDSMFISVVLMEEGVPASGGVLTSKDLDNIDFNPYLVVNQERGKEIHLIDMPPTALASNKYFGEQEDVSNAGQGKYYRSRSNVPWMIAVASCIPYANEKTDFSKAFTKFIEWAESGGTKYEDWYLNNGGYRDEKSLFTK